MRIADRSEKLKLYFEKEDRVFTFAPSIHSNSSPTKKFWISPRQ